MLLSSNTTKTMEIQETSLHPDATNKFEQTVLFIPSLKVMDSDDSKQRWREQWAERTEVGKIVHLKPISQELKQIVKDRGTTYSQTDWSSRMHTKVFEHLTRNKVSYLNL